MVTVFLIHGSYGSPAENWFPWLTEKLKSVGCKVYALSFPTPKGQSLKSWTEAFKTYESKLDEKTIIIGHSIGATFALHLIQNSKSPIKAAFLVSGFVTPANDPKNKFTEINKTFYENQFDWNKIKERCRSFYIINSDNDQYVTPSHAEKISKPLGVILTIIEGGGHFNKSSGYQTFPQLLQMIEDEISSKP